MPLPDGTVTDAMVNNLAGISALKLEHQFPLNAELFNATTPVSATSKTAHIVQGATGEVVSVQAFVTTPATGADRTANVDLQRSRAGGAFATILSSTVTFNNASAALTPATGLISSADLLRGDLLQYVVTVAGSTGSQAVGLSVTAFLREDPA